MARHTFGGGAMDLLISAPSGKSGLVVSLPNQAGGTAWSAKSGGTQYTDLVAVAGGTPVCTDSNGYLYQFQGPAGVTDLWVDFGAGTRYHVVSTDTLSGLLPEAGAFVAVTPEQYGAVGDGTTDDSAALQAAMDAVFNAGGGAVILGPKNYAFATTLSVPWPGIVAGHGRQASTLTYTGTGTGLQMYRAGTAEQKLWVVLRDFTLIAASATTGINAKGMTHGVIERVVITGVTSPTAITAGTVGLLWDGSYGASSGAWWNTARWCDISGWDAAVKSTGVAGAGQANENHVETCKLGGWNNKGFWIDVGDHNSISRTDLTLNTAGSVGVYVNDSQARVIDCRFESVDIAVEIASAGARYAVIDKNSISGSVTVGVQIDAAAGVSTTLQLGDNYNNAVTPVSDLTSGTTTTADDLNRHHQNFVPFNFVLGNLTASMVNSPAFIAGSAVSQLAYIGRPYQIRGVSFRYSNNITAGTLTVTPGVSGTPSTSLSASATTGKTGANHQGMGKDANAGTSAIECYITTSSTFAATGGEVYATVWVEFT